METFPFKKSFFPCQVDLRVQKNMAVLLRYLPNISHMPLAFLRFVYPLCTLLKDSTRRPEATHQMVIFKNSCQYIYKQACLPPFLSKQTLSQHLLPTAHFLVNVHSPPQKKGYEHPVFLSAVHKKLLF